jgi:hypothetical protein
MSHYSKVTTRLIDEAALLKALADLGFAAVEVHERPLGLRGYKGDLREDTAHVIIRRRYISPYSNDIGFLRQADGSFAAIISEFDADGGYDQAWLDRLGQRYAYHVAVTQLTAQGFSLIEEQDENGELVLTLTR